MRQVYGEGIVYVFLLIIAALLFLPLMTLFNDVLTTIVKNLDAYRVIEQYVVPWEMRMAAVLLYAGGFEPKIVGTYLALGTKDPLLVEIAWNCVGWQSLLFFILTGWVGLQGDRYTGGSKMKAFTIGLLGTFLVNIFRITIVILAAIYFGQTIAEVVHQFGSILAILIWLIFFWWFTYQFVLEETGESEADVHLTGML